MSKYEHLFMPEGDGHLAVSYSVLRAINTPLECTRMLKARYEKQQKRQAAYKSRNNGLTPEYLAWWVEEAKALSTYGAVFPTYLLDPQGFQKQYVFEKTNRASNVGKARFAELAEQGLVGLDPEMEEELQFMAECMQANPYFQQLMQQKDYEVCKLESPIAIRLDEDGVLIDQVKVWRKVHYRSRTDVAFFFYGDVPTIKSWEQHDMHWRVKAAIDLMQKDTPELGKQKYHVFTIAKSGENNHFLVESIESGLEIFWHKVSQIRQIHEEKSYLQSYWGLSSQTNIV
jgi:hypothetical protein